MSDASGVPGGGPGAIERPALSNEPGDYWGSDAVALMLREVGLPYVALNPGASYRGLHDSLVNLLGNRDPQMLLCLHEEHAVAIAHGYAKVAGRPMGAIVHSNVGLMHATMAIFDAWCDRVPVFVLGATGPVDAAKRRPWIDWIPYRPGPGGAGSQLHQMGRPAGLGRGGGGIGFARLSHDDDPALRPGLCLYRCRLAGEQDRRPSPFTQRRPVPPAAAERGRPGGAGRSRGAAPES
jgi:hypothetical protein